MATLSPVFLAGAFLCGFGVFLFGLLAFLNAILNSKIEGLKDLFNAKIEPLKENQVRMEKRMDNIEKRMDSMEKRMDSIEIKLDQLIAAKSA